MKLLNILLVMFFVSSLSFAQNVPIDFETGGNGADWTWTVFENTEPPPPLEIIENPYQEGINTSSTVAKFTAKAGGEPWAGCESLQGADIGEYYISGTVIKIMVYKTVISDVGIKLVSSTNWALVEKKVSNTVINQWEELTFDFSDYSNPTAGNGVYNQIVVFPDFDLEGRTQDNIIYFDNISFSAPVDGPNAPTGFVGSNMLNDNPLGDGEVFLVCGPNDVEQADIRFRLFYSKSDEAPADPKTATEYEFGTIEGDGGGNTAFGFIMTGLQPGTSYNFWLYQYDETEELFSPAPAIQVVVSGGDVTNVPMVAAPTPIHEAENVISLFSDAYTDVSVDTWRTEWSVATYEEVEIQDNPTKKYSNLDFVGIETIANQINIADMTYFHIDVWSYNFTQLRVKIVDFGPDAAWGGDDDTEHEITFDDPAPAQGEWISLDIPLDDFIDLTGRQNISQLIFSALPVGAATIYIDNVYFHNSTANIDNISANQIQVYPNPVSIGGQVQLSQEVKQVDVFDLGGRIINSQNYTSNINTEDLNQGWYLLKIQTIEGESQIQKIVIK